MDMNCSYEIRFLVPFSSSCVFIKNTVNMHSGMHTGGRVTMKREERIRLALSTRILSQVFKNMLQHSKRVMTYY